MRRLEYCKPVLAKKVPTGPDWIHEIKYDGDRGRVVRDGKAVKLFSRSGLDLTWRFPFIVETALKVRQTQFIIDGEICVLDVQGISDFNALHSNRHNEEAQLYAFDLAAVDGDDLREEPLHARKARLDKLLKADRKASSSPRSNPVRSAQDYSRRPAGWGWRTWFQSTASGATGPGPATG